MFEDRKEAGEKLARALVKYKDKDAMFWQSQKAEFR